MSAARRTGEEQGFTLVELLVVLLLLGVITTAIMQVIRTTSRAERTSSALATVMDDARLSMDNLRLELRGARRVYPTSDDDTLDFWLDANFDNIQQTSEQVTYQVETIGSNRFVINRWTAANTTAKRTMAKTLLNDDPFSYDIAPPSTRVVTIDLTLQVEKIDPLQPLDVTGTVRLRNVADPI